MFSMIPVVSLKRGKKLSKVLATLPTPLPALVVAGTAAAGARTRPKIEKTTELFIVTYENARQIEGVLGVNELGDCRPRMAPHHLLISLDPFFKEPLFTRFLETHEVKHMEERVLSARIAVLNLLSH
jgi:hypothetical protein